MKLLALLCIVAWRVFWASMISRSVPNAPATVALTKREADVLDKAVPGKVGSPGQPRTLRHCIEQVARLGGYLARGHDPPPGNMVLWRGWTRLGV